MEEGRQLRMGSYSQWERVTTVDCESSSPSFDDYGIAIRVIEFDLWQ